MSETIILLVLLNPLFVMITHTNNYIIATLVSNLALDVLEFISLGIFKGVLKKKVISADQFYYMEIDLNEALNASIDAKGELYQARQLLAITSTERDEAIIAQDQLQNEKVAVMSKIDTLFAQLEAAAAKKATVDNNTNKLR